MQMLGSVSANNKHSSAVTKCLQAWKQTPKILSTGTPTKSFLITAQGMQEPKKINDESYDRRQQPAFRDAYFCSGTLLHNTPGNSTSSSAALWVAVQAHLSAPTNTLQGSAISWTLSTMSCLLLTPLLDSYIPGLNGMVLGFLVSPLIQVHRHQGRALTIAFPKSAASSYQNLQDRSKQEACIITQDCTVSENPTS